MESIRILGTGSYVPETVLTNHDLEKLYNEHLIHLYCLQISRCEDVLHSR